MTSSCVGKGCKNSPRWRCDDGKLRCDAHFHHDADGGAVASKTGKGYCCKNVEAELKRL